MRFALYHPWVYLRGGAERLLVETLERSRHDWTVYTHHHDREATFEGLRGPEVVELTPRVSVRRSLGPLVHAAATMGRATIPDDGAQALLVSSEGLGDLLLRRATLPAVAFCHTPLKILHDPATRQALRERDRRKSAVLDVLGPAFHRVDRQLWKRYEHVLVNSNEVRRRVLAADLVTEDRVEVLNPGADPGVFRLDEARLARLDMTTPATPMFLVAGRIMWQKNIELALDALRQVTDRGVAVRLVIAGAVDEKSESYFAALRQRAAGLPVTFEVAPTTERLAALYREAAALLFTPCNEDWGIVPIEAMSSGTPVLAVAAGGPAESILHGRTGWLLPNDATAFANQMHAVAASAVGRPSELVRMGVACRERAQAFTWNQFVSRLDDVMEDVALRRPVRERLEAPAPALSHDLAQEQALGLALDHEMADITSLNVLPAEDQVLSAS